MKFCVIDYNIVISGSANWSNKAFTVNNEEVTIVIGHQQRANDFITEFERLKLLSGKIKSLENKIPNVEIQAIQSTSVSNTTDILSLRSDIDSLINKQKETENVLKEFKELAIKRLEILKSAIQALETMVEEQYVIEDDGNTQVDVNQIERNLLK
jgi:phosphatidylserine/phosphatidylglycerophosphate/cardiolipin synthase-like enzyme